uniref:Pentatricopeptide repeat-containing protein n=1 Tax=Ananas comosus var. bracteatus TaxID=296719 RepID=A0A6V7P9M3_ANACO|nr:unnamed protein product [Ananas comosus var. bracteatus]
MVVVFPPPSSDRPQQPIPRRRHHHLIPLPVVPLPFLPVAALESFFFSALLRSAASLPPPAGARPPPPPRPPPLLLPRLQAAPPPLPPPPPPLHSYPLRAFLSVPTPTPSSSPPSSAPAAPPPTSSSPPSASSPSCAAAASPSPLHLLRPPQVRRRRPLPPRRRPPPLPRLSLGAFPSHLFVANSSSPCTSPAPTSAPPAGSSTKCPSATSSPGPPSSSPTPGAATWSPPPRSSRAPRQGCRGVDRPGHGYAHNAMPGEALDAFVRMRDAGVTVDEVALVGAISACAQLGAVSRARWVRVIAEANGFGTNVVVGSALVDMYAKCGLIDNARQVFDEMPERNVYTYSSMIAGLASHGRAHEAIALFREMVGATNVAPNRVTLIGVLTACSHAGMVEEGRFFFAQMKDKYRIPRSADHYACMVDLLGRAGLVEEALELVKSMPIKPHGGVWGHCSVLAGSTISLKSLRLRPTVSLSSNPNASEAIFSYRTSTHRPACGMKSRKLGS